MDLVVITHVLIPKQKYSLACRYVEQTDIHVPESTVHEALLFSARLRLPSSISSQAAKDYVEEVCRAKRK